MADGEEIAAAFQLFDRGGKGFVLASEVNDLLYSLGVEMEVEMEGGSLTFEDFSKLVTPRMPHRVLNDTDVLFDIFDVEGTGYLNSRALHQVNAELGEMLSEQDIADILREAGPQGISREEFYRQILVESEFK